MFDQFPKVKLSEICSINIGGTPAREVAKFWAESHDGVAWVSIADMKQKYISKTKEYISKSGALSSNVKLIPADSLLMSFKLTVGKVAINTVDLYCNEAIAFFNPLNDSVSLDWLFHVLPLVTANTVTDTAVKGATLNKEKINNLDIPLPEIAVQRKIVKVLDTLDLEIEQTKGIIGKLENSKAGLLNDLLTCGVDSQGNLRPSYEDAPDLYQETELGFIPKEWDAQKINAYLVSDAGIKPGPFGSSVKKEFYKADGFKIYGQEQVIAGNQHIGDYYISESKFNDLIDFAVKENDILISLVGTIGKVLRLSLPLKKGIINPRLMRLRPNIQLCNPNFLAILLASDFYVNQVTAKAGGGTMSVINKSIISSVSVPIIPIDEQMKIVEIYNGIDTKYKLEINNLKKLQKMKKGLLQDLLQN